MAGKTTKKTENVEAVKEVAAVEVEEKVTPIKKNTTRKTKEVAPEEKKATTKSKTTTGKTTTEKKTTKKTTTKKASAEKKAETSEQKEVKRKTTTKKVDKNVVFEFHGVQTQINVDEYEDKIKDKWLNDWNRLAKDLKAIELYIKPEDGKVYFVINGTDHGEIDM